MMLASQGASCSLCQMLTPQILEFFKDLFERQCYRKDIFHLLINSLPKLVSTAVAGPKPGDSCGSPTWVQRSQDVSECPCGMPVLQVD